jgi:hypothetical protein
VDGTVEPVGDGDRSRATISLDLKGYGIGKVLLPLFVRRQAHAEMPKNTLGAALEVLLQPFPSARARHDNADTPLRDTCRLGERGV